MSVGSWLSGNIIGSGVDTSRTDQLTDRFMSELDPYKQREASGYGQEQDLANQLQGAANGTAPSAAQTQLGNSLGDLYRQYSSMGAGARGTGGLLSRYGAMNGLGDAAVKTNGQAMLGRIAEQYAASQRLSQLLQAMTGQSKDMYGVNLGGALAANNQSNSLKQANAQANQQAFAALLKTFTDAAGVFGGGGVGGTAGGSGGGSGGGGGGGGVTNMIGGGDNGGGDALAALALA